MRKVFDGKTVWMKIIFVGVVLVSIKHVFLDLGVDFEYAIVQAYRMVKGDHMIAQMWEPHQTSAFLNAFFIKIFLMLTGSTTGIALYLNAMGLAVKLGVAYVFYRTLRAYCDRDILFFMCAFFVTVNAKEFIILDFSNMMIYFSVLLFCCLFLSFQRQESGRKRSVFVMAASVCFCLEVLSYPSTVLLFPFLLAILYRYSATRKKDMFLFTAISFLFGGTYITYLIAQVGWERLGVSLHYILTGDESHRISRYGDQLKNYMTDIGSMILVFGIFALLAFLIGKLLGRIRGKLLTGFHYVQIFALLFYVCNLIQLAVDVTDIGFSVTIRLLYAIVYVPILILASRLKKYCGKEEWMAFRMGAEISIVSCAAVLLLTDCTLLVSLPYLLLGIMVSMIPIGAYLREAMPDRGRAKKYGLLILFLLLAIFRNLYNFIPANGSHATILSVRQVIKEGPMQGLLSNYMGGYMRNTNWEDWERYVQDGDRILIVGNPVSTIGYLYKDTEICVDSTISTPTFYDKLLTYWELNPWKEPNVVILDCWYGEPLVSEDTWIMGWIEDNFDSYEEGKFVRIYRRELP